jgi:uncharacterized protein
MLIADMKRIVQEQRLGFVTTGAPDGTRNVSTKGTFFVLDDTTIACGEIRSPGTLRNLRENPRLEVNFVNPFARTGSRCARMISRSLTRRHVRADYRLARRRYFGTSCLQRR